VIKNQVAIIVVILAHRKHCVVVEVEHTPIENLLHGLLEVSLRQLADSGLSIELVIG
jgi:hypothetical protein